MKYLLIGSFLCLGWALGGASFYFFGIETHREERLIKRHGYQEEELLLALDSNQGCSLWTSQKELFFIYSDKRPFKIVRRYW